MFSSSINYNKLKANLSLAINRLKLLEKKKTELALKSRKEIADYIAANKTDRARIRVEHIIREEYLVEAMELLELFCDLLLARYGLITSQHNPDESIEEAISSIIWVAPRMVADVQEFKVISELFKAKYGKEYHEICLANTHLKANDKLIKRMSIAAPSRRLVEAYLVEIANSYSVPFDPDQSALNENSVEELISFPEPKDDTKPGNSGGSGGNVPPPLPASVLANDAPNDNTYIFPASQPVNPSASDQGPAYWAKMNEAAAADNARPTSGAQPPPYPRNQAAVREPSSDDDVYSQPYYPPRANTGTVAPPPTAHSNTLSPDYGLKGDQPRLKTDGLPTYSTYLSHSTEGADDLSAFLATNPGGSGDASAPIVPVSLVKEVSRFQLPSHILPSVPAGNVTGGDAAHNQAQQPPPGSQTNASQDLDDLAKRFESLKKR